MFTKKLFFIFLFIPIFSHSQSKWITGITFVSSFSNVHASAKSSNIDPYYSYYPNSYYYQSKIRHINNSKPLLDLSFGVNVGYKLSDRFNLISGLSYTSLSYQADSLGYTYHYANYVSITDTRTKVRTYSLEIPLIFVYKINLSNFSFFLTAGGVFGEVIRFRRKSYFDQDKDIKPQVLKRGEGGPFHIDVSAGLGAAFKISEKGSIILSPNFRYNFFNSNTKKTYIKQTAITYSLQLSYLRNF